MALYLLDTTTVTLLWHGNARVQANIIARPHDTIAVTVVNVEEVLTGWQTNRRQAKTNADRAAASRVFARAVRLLTPFPVYPFTELALDHCDALVRLRLNVGGKDLQIAAIALDLGATVVTNNLRDFGRVPGLAVEDWAA
jgi:tRNA(fMet)-specific endonuclease VapC